MKIKKINPFNVMQLDQSIKGDKLSDKNSNVSTWITSNKIRQNGSLNNSSKQLNCNTSYQQSDKISRNNK
jgi:hypothetical protein